jgi:Ca2+-binding EF-hand superfamily protein
MLTQTQVRWTLKAFSNQKGNDNEISKERFLKIMAEHGADEEFASTIFDFFDENHSGTIDIHEVHNCTQSRASSNRLLSIW